MKNTIKKILKEEFNNKVSRGEFLNRIISFFVDDTELDYDDETWATPLVPNYPLPIFLLEYSSIPDLPLPYDKNLLFTSIFRSYFNDTYGLTDDESQYIWGEYKEIILGKFGEEGIFLDED